MFQNGTLRSLYLTAHGCGQIWADGVLEGLPLVCVNREFHIRFTQALELSTVNYTEWFRILCNTSSVMDQFLRFHNPTPCAWNWQTKEIHSHSHYLYSLTASPLQNLCLIIRNVLPAKGHGTFLLSQTKQVKSFIWVCAEIWNDLK